MRNSLFFIILISSIQYAYSQKRTGYLINKAVVNLEIGYGGSYLNKNEISNQLDIGNNLEIGLRFNNPKQTFHATLFYNFKRFDYRESSTYISSVYQRLDISKLGTRLNFKISQSKNMMFSFYTFLDISKTWVSNYLDNIISEGYKTYYKDSRLDYSNGDLFSMAFGYRLLYGIFYLEGSYDILNPEMTLSKEFIEVLEKEDVDFNKKTDIVLNSIGIRIGVTIPLSFFGTYESIKIEQKSKYVPFTN